MMRIVGEIMSTRTTAEWMAVLPDAGIAFTLSQSPAGTRRPPPRYAEHTRAILAVSGYGADAVERMCRARTRKDHCGFAEYMVRWRSPRTHAGVAAAPGGQTAVETV